ncbi:MAG: hypothetical protein KF846_14925 [Cyclobacteriaceae bacterium]|nr:hypothetical protein [Cyclobacteriaceae bacterium]MBX2957455.1 hypothetical protein [Cyclobacteriaceae bacterium]
MELRDLIVTPIVIILVYVAAYLIRPRVTDAVNRKYFFPALSLRIFGALALGFLYQFYYHGGDTFNYHTHGSRHIWEAFMDSPVLGWKLLTSGGEPIKGAYAYTSSVIFYTDPSSFFVVRIAALFDLFTFSSYAATAVLFAVVSFLGAWSLFFAFYRESPQHHPWIAIATLFIPSVIFWGSGLLKDTLTLAAIGFLTLAVSNFFRFDRKKSFSVMLLILSVWILYSIKKYILLCFLPAAILWIYASYLARIKSLILKVLIVPVIFALLVGSGYYSIILIGKDDPKYSLDRIATTAQVTAYDIGFYTGKDAGSGYSLGELDGTFGNMMSKAPQAINVSLFRPYLWEVKNPLMLLTAMESVLLLVATLVIIMRYSSSLIYSFRNPTVLFCLVFSFSFAFAVGVSTFNFGTLARYKIPLLPFYVLALGYIYYNSNNKRKSEALALTE